MAELQTKENLIDFCRNSIIESSTCPEDVCFFGCLGGINFNGCQLACQPKSCLDISASKCPLDTCQVMKGCEEGKKVCFPKTTAPPSPCGGLGYDGQDVECCEGFIKRCGVEFFDKTCDMVGKNSIYSIPICIPCGNGICNQFENHCNCPEDCP